MNTYNPRSFVERIRGLITNRTNGNNKMYKVEHLNMCVAANVPDTFLYDIETYEQRPRIEILERLATHFEVTTTFLLFGN